MRSILRFLCVLIMLQVATPLMHGMEGINGDVESSSMSERSPLIEKSKKSSSGCSTWIKVAAVLGALGLVLIAGDITLWAWNRTTPAEKIKPIPCSQVPWDRWGTSCSKGSEERPFEFAVTKCQAKLLGEDFAVAGCNGDRNNSFVVVDWEDTTDLKQTNCSGLLDEEDGLYFGYCSPQEAIKVREFCNEYEAPYCEVRTRSGIGIAMMPRYGKNYYFYQTKWFNEIFDQAEKMEGKVCKPFANEARRLAQCGTSFAFNNEDPNEPKRSKQKSKKRKRRNRRT